MRFFRQLSTARLLALLAAVTAAAVGASIASMAALGSSAQTPPPKQLDQALEDALKAPRPAGVTARVRFTNNLFPSGALSGITGSESSALTSGGSGRLWWSPDGRGRIELQSNAGDAQILWDQQKLTVWDSSSNTVYKLPLPAHAAGSESPAPPTLADIDGFLKQLAEQANVAGPIPVDVAGEPAYSVSVTPAHSAGLIGSLDLAWDAAHGVPLEIGLHAQGQSSPVVALTVTEITFGTVSDSDFAVTPPASAKTIELGGSSQPADPAGGEQKTAGAEQHVTGLSAVQAAVPFTVVAPETLVGLPRQSVQLIGGADKGALILYGHGLGGIVLLERTASSAQKTDQTSGLPSVALGGVTGQELATQLGTVVLFDQGGVSFVLAGSMPPTAAETAARSLG